MTFLDQKDFIKQEIKKIFSSLGENITVNIIEYDGCSPELYVNYCKSNSPTYIGQFRMQSVDGGLNVFFGHVHLENIYQNKGYGVKLHKLRLTLAKNFGAHSVLATTGKNNIRQNRIMEHFNWTRTDLTETHYLWHKDLTNYNPEKKNMG